MLRKVLVSLVFAMSFSFLVLFYSVHAQSGPVVWSSNFETGDQSNFTKTTSSCSNPTIGVASPPPGSSTTPNFGNYAGYYYGGPPVDSSARNCREVADGRISYGLSDFYWEMWVYVPSQYWTPGVGWISFATFDSGDTNPFTIDADSSGHLALDVVSTGHEYGENLVSNQVFPTNQWFKLSLVAHGVGTGNADVVVSVNGQPWIHVSDVSVDAGKIEYWHFGLYKDATIGNFVVYNDNILIEDLSGTTSTTTTMTTTTTQSTTTTIPTSTTTTAHPTTTTTSTGTLKIRSLGIGIAISPSDSSNYKVIKVGAADFSTSSGTTTIGTLHLDHDHYKLTDVSINDITLSANVMKNGKQVGTYSAVLQTHGNNDVWYGQLTINSQNWNTYLIETFKTTIHTTTTYTTTTSPHETTTTTKTITSTTTKGGGSSTTTTISTQGQVVFSDDFEKDPVSDLPSAGMCQNSVYVGGGDTGTTAATMTGCASIPYLRTTYPWYWRAASSGTCQGSKGGEVYYCDLGDDKCDGGCVDWAGTGVMGPNSIYAIVEPSKDAPIPGVTAISGTNVAKLGASDYAHDKTDMAVILPSGLIPGGQPISLSFWVWLSPGMEQAANNLYVDIPYGGQARYVGGTGGNWLIQAGSSPNTWATTGPLPMSSQTWHHIVYNVGPSGWNSITVDGASVAGVAGLHAYGSGGDTFAIWIGPGTDYESVYSYKSHGFSSPFFIYVDDVSISAG